MLRPLKAATPATAFFVAVPLKIPRPGFDPIAIVIEAVEAVTIFPRPSCTATIGGPESAEPAAAFAGCATSARFVAAPETVNTVTALLVAIRV